MLKDRSSAVFGIAFIFLLLSCSSIVLGQSCPGKTPGCIQTGTAVDWDGQTSLTLANDVAAGDTLAVGIRWLSAQATLTSLTVSGNCAVAGGFVLPKPSNGTNPSVFVAGTSTAVIAYGVVTTGGHCTITSKLSAPVGQYLTVHELNVGPYDCSSVNHQDYPGGGNNAVTSLSCATSANGDYLLGEFFDMYGNGGTWTAGTGFVLEAKSGEEGSQTEDDIQSSAGPVAATFTTSLGYDRPTTSLMAFQPATSGQGNFSISAAPPSLTIGQGNQGNSTITSTISGGFDSSISLFASGAPAGVGIAFTPAMIGAPGAGSSTMTIMVGSNTPTGTYPITVTGSGGGVQQHTTVSLTVTGQAGFTLTASPNSLSVAQGDQGTSTITTTISGGFNSSISLSATGAPIRTTIGFNPQIIGAPGAGTSTMTISVAGDTPVGTYPITVTGNGGGIQQQATVSLTVTAPGQFLWSGIIDPSRAVDWSEVGVPGGIPVRTKQCGSTIAAYSGTAAKINSAIAACPSGQFVSLAAGTFHLSSGIDFTNGSGLGVSNVTLRGMGADKTFLAFTKSTPCTGLYTDICMEGDASGLGGSGYSPDNSATWTATSYAKGQTQITLSSVNNLRVGSYLFLDQCNDGLSGATCGTGKEADTGNIWVCETYGAGCNDTVNGAPTGSQRAHRDQLQIVTVTAINGKLVTFSPALYMPNWSAARSPGAFWSSHPAVGDGVENLSLDHTNSANNQAGITMENCVGCWVKGIRSVSPNRNHVWLFLSPRAVIRDSYFYGSWSVHSEGYGVETFPSGDCLIENNIFQRMPSPEQFNGGASGCVVGYNFSIYDINDSNFLFNSMTLHGGTQDSTLVEGNVGNSYRADLFHGSHNINTTFRNYWNGWENGITGGLVSVYLDPLARYFNIIGNVLGKTGVHNLYQQTPSGGNGTPIYIIGTGTQEVQLSGDPLTVNSLMRWGNYDTVTGAVRWCGNSSDPGWYTTCSGISEVPSTLSPYGNPVPASTTLPASFYYATRPYWWPASKPWPAIGPDVTGGNVPNVGGHVFTIPAQDCYSNVMRGPADGSGPVLSFNADACYSVPNGPKPHSPDRPTNLTATPR